MIGQSFVKYIYLNKNMYIIDSPDQYFAEAVIELYQVNESTQLLKNNLISINIIN